MATEEMINEIHALVAAAVKGENERIIKLLEQSNRCANEFGHEYVPDCYCEAIELIKEGIS